MDEQLLKVIEEQVEEQWTSEYELGANHGESIENFLQFDSWFSCDSWLDYMFENQKHFPGVKFGDEEETASEIEAANKAAEMYSAKVKAFREEYCQLMDKYFPSWRKAWI
ncbi:MAG: hypothetical protein AB7V25_17165 [Mangrovibacterium sp.]